MITLGSIIVSFFRNHLANQRGFTLDTIKSYSDCVRLLMSYACEKLGVSFDKFRLEDINDQLILDFLDYLEQERGNKPETRNQRLGAIKTFFRFLALQEPTLAEVCERVCGIKAKKTEHKVIATLDDQEIKKILDTIETGTLQGARDQALLFMLYNTGARVQELVGLDFSDVRMEKPMQVLLTGKGRKQRVVPLWEETVTAIQHYREMREKAGIEHKAVFLNYRGKRITRFGIRHIVTKHVAAAAMNCPSLTGKNVTPHTFRHTLALHLIQSGSDITLVKEWLGHADIKTTSIYIEIDIEMKRKALEAYPSPVAPQTNEPEAPLWHDTGVMKFLRDLSRKPALC